jgi:hypothetical protein
MLQVVATLTDESRVDVYGRNMFTVNTAGPTRKDWICHEKNLAGVNTLARFRLMFAGKAGAYPSEAPFRCSTPG